MAMPHTQSPHQLSPEDVSPGFGHTSKGYFCTPGPLPASASPRPSRIASTMTTAYTNTASPKDKHHPPMNYSDNSGLPWNPYVMPAQYTPESSALYDFTGLPYTTNNELSYPAFESDPSCPRSYTAGLGLTDPMGNMSMTEAYPPSAYVISPPKSHDDHGMDLPCQNTSPLLSAMNTDCDSKPSHLNLPDSAYDSPYGSVVGTPCSTTLDEVPVMKNEGEENPLDKEQPYAQLIYRALMDAPGHTMILRDIYNWFKTNTDKAADKETKGWQNSIRHNLSMNGAFEKVDQPNEDVSKKGFMWKLTDEAIREGVKSTTRYRSKQPNKRNRTSHNPLPQRQASGAKGGQASKRSQRLKRSQRHHEPYARSVAIGEGYGNHQYRSVPATYSHSHSHEHGMLSGEPSLSYPNSPYSFTSGNSELDFSCAEDFGAHNTQLMEPFTYTPTTTTTAFRQDGFYDSAYVLPPNQDNESLFYGTDDCDTSPSGSEPRTPDSQMGDAYLGVWSGVEESAWNLGGGQPLGGGFTSSVGFEGRAL